VDRGAIGGARHQPVEDVELANQMALADPADRRVAAHLAEVFGAEADQADASAAARRRCRRLAAGMTAANDQDIEHSGPLAESGFRRNAQKGFT
jgi:hypothetical protein